MLVCGCGRSVTSQIQALEDPDALATHAFALLDTSGDGVLDQQELIASPGLRAGAQRIDSDGSGDLSREELLARLQAMAAGSDFVGMQINLIKSGRPLSNATLTLTPEPFFGDHLQSYEGETDLRGSCFLRGKQMRTPGIPTGYYTAHVVQAATGTDEKVGCEIADDASGSRLTLEF